MQNTPSKKIAFLLTSLISGGEERNAAILAKYLAKEVELVCVLFNGPIDFALPDSVSVKILRPDYQWRILRLLTLPLVVWKYYRFCQQEKITHSIAFDTLPNFTNCLLKLFGWKGKAFLRVTSHVSARFPESSLRGQLFRWLIKKLYPQSAGVFVNARRIAMDLVTDYGIKVPIYLSYNPMDLQGIAELQNATISADGKFTFIHVAMFRPGKNHALLLQAFARIKHLNVQLWLIGKGDLQAATQALAEQLGISQQVHFLGFQQNHYQYIAAADCLVLSSDYEGHPRVLSEGLACGLPVISTDCPSGPRETIAPDTDKHQQVTSEIELAKYGILTPVGNAEKLAEAMKYVYENPNYRKGDFFKERVEPFRVERIVKELMEYLNT